MQPSKHCSDCGELKPLTEFHTRRASPDGLAYKCRDCVNRFSIEWREKNPGAFKAWYAANKEDRAEYWQAWYSENREARAQSYSAWEKANPAQRNALNAKRRAAQLRAKPAWANLDAIQAFYTEAARLTKETGIRHEVDHIIPLQGKLICGFHHEDNLQILTRTENAHKRNKFSNELLALTGT